MQTKPSLVQLLIACFCLSRCYDLVVFWQTADNAEYWGWVIFLLWLVPLGLTWILYIQASSERRFFPALSICGLIMSTLGMLGSLNVLEHMGFACASAALMPWSAYTLLWLIGSVCWMPAFTWLSGHLMPTYSFIGRCLLVSLLLVVYYLKNVKLSPVEEG